MEKRYIVMDENSRGDTYTQTFRTAEEANSAAEMAWGYLTKSERKTRHVAVYVQTEDMLDADMIEDYGIDGAWGSGDMDNFPGAFDSDSLEI